VRIKSLCGLGFLGAAVAGGLQSQPAQGQPESPRQDDHGYYALLDPGMTSARDAGARSVPISGRVGDGAGSPAAEPPVGTPVKHRPDLAAASLPVSQKWGAWLDLEGKAGSKRNIGEADVFLPLWQDGTSLLFGNLKTRLDDDHSREGNLGAGVRHMLESGWNIGVYGYFDRRKTEHDNYFNQVTLGAEALSLDWDFRVNAYLPEGRRSKNADRLNTAELSGTTVLFRGGEERSLQGFDAEIGWRVPVFAGAEPTQLRVYGGGYRFYADGVNPVQGPRGRAELVFDEVPGLWDGARLSLGAEAQHDGPRGGQVFAVARLRVPLQVFGGGSPAQLTPMERRMTDPVIRDVDVVSQAGNSFSAPETATATASGGALSVLSSSTTTGAGLGTAVAAAGANSTVILSGSFSTTTNVVTLQSGQTLMGSGTVSVRSPSGRTATLNTGASGTIAGTVSAGNAATVEITNSNSTLSGLTVTNTLATGTVVAVHVGAVSGTTIADNTITATKTGAAANPVVAINLPAVSSNTTIRGNTLTATANGDAGSEAQGIRALGASTTVTVSGNSFNSSGSGLAANDNTIKADAGAVSFVTAASTGNVIVNGSHVCTAATGSVSFTNGTTCP
jgi:hypothetical protein